MTEFGFAYETYLLTLELDMVFERADGNSS